MKEHHMIGLAHADDPDPPRIREVGFEWLRFGVGFPFEDRLGGELRPRFVQRLERAGELRNAGLNLLGTVPGPGSKRYDRQRGITTWQSSLPDWLGTPGEDEYFHGVGEACAEIATQTRGLIDWFQIANEPDIDIFRGPLSEQQMIRYLQAGASGVKRGNPNAKVGINLGFMTDDARRLLDALYTSDDDTFDYIGIDGYFGSWQKGGPSDWVAYIDEAHERTGKPVIINEWGYSSLQSGPITDDPDRTKPYNQDVCRNKAWPRAWRHEHSPQEQAEYVRECVRIFAEHPHVIGNFFFRWEDAERCWQCGQPQCPAECAWGIVDVEGNPKPAYHALTQAIVEHLRYRC